MMVITGKDAEGYRIECSGKGLMHSFVVKSLGLEVRCPSCGQREASLDLANTYVFMRRASHFGKEDKRRKARATKVADIANDCLFARHSTEWNA